MEKLTAEIIIAIYALADSLLNSGYMVENRGYTLREYGPGQHTALLCECLFTACKRYGLAPLTVVPVALFDKAYTLRCDTYSPYDKGARGKMVEVETRLALKKQHGVKWCYWYEFSARRQNTWDIRQEGMNIENKSGCGDWLYSKRYSTWEGIIAQYEKKDSVIRWQTKFFDITCTWAQLLQYLREYNGELKTWFKAAVKYNPTSEKYVLQMQEFSTSKRKIRFLQDCPYNDYIPFEEEE